MMLNGLWNVLGHSDQRRFCQSVLRPWVYAFAERTINHLRFFFIFFFKDYDGTVQLYMGCWYFFGINSMVVGDP